MECQRIWLIYIRKSVVRDDTDLESPERQLSNCQKRLEITETQPYKLEVYQDLDRSGIKEQGREGWLKLKGRLGDPDVIGVIANSFDRLYRNVYEFLAFLNEIERWGKVLVTANGFLDTSNPFGRFSVTVLMAMYEMESLLTSLRMRDMIEYKRREQGRHWGGVPFGCDRDEVTGQLVPGQKTYTLEQETRYFYDGLVECFRLYSSGNHSYQQVARILNANGWRFYDRYNNILEWNEDRVRGVVGRWRLYQGQLPMGNPVKDKGLEYIEGGHQPILPAELCAAAGSVLNTRSRLVWSKVGANKRVYLLSDFTYCASCGMRMIGQFEATSQRRIYRHKLAKGDCPEVWVDAEALEEKLLSGFFELANHPQIMKWIEEDAATLDCCPEDESPKINEIQKRLERLEDIYVNDGAIDKDSYLSRRSSLLSQLMELQPKPQGIEVSSQVEMLLSSIHLIEYAEESTKKALLSELISYLGIASGTIHSLTPKDNYTPIFDRVVNGPGGSRTQITRDLILVNWLNNASIAQENKDA